MRSDGLSDVPASARAAGALKNSIAWADIISGPEGRSPAIHARISHEAPKANNVEPPADTQRF